MPRPKKESNSALLDMPEQKEVPLNEMPLEKLADYVRYNRKARELNKKLGKCEYPPKICPIDKHPKDRVKFIRNDQPSNPLKVFLSNEYIHFDDTLIPGKVYDLPRVVIKYLSDKGTPIWKKRTLPDGTIDTYKEGYRPRFALVMVYDGE